MVIMETPPVIAPSVTGLMSIPFRRDLQKTLSLPRFLVRRDQTPCPGLHHLVELDGEYFAMIGPVKTACRIGLDRWAGLIRQARV
jgi:hypothetical protein